MEGGRGGNRKLVPNIGPLLQTLGRICVDPIDTRHDVDVRVSFNWRRNNDDNGDAVKKANNCGEGGSIPGEGGDGGR